MTKKDFTLIAEAIAEGRAIWKRKTNNEEREVAMPVIEELAEIISDALATTNERFDRERFLEACGL